MLDSQKLDFILANMATKDDIANMATKDDIANMATKDDIANMATKDDIANMATKDDIANMATKDDLAELESNLLTKIGTVQEKANDHFARMERWLDLLTNRVNVIDIEFRNANLLEKSIIDLQHRVDAIELKIS